VALAPLVPLRKAPPASFGQRHCPTMVPLVVSSGMASRYRGETHHDQPVSIVAVNSDL
jgi:hypothetical protein